MTATAVAGAAALAATLVPGSAPAQPTVNREVGFEDVASLCSFDEARPLRDRYAGLRFRGLGDRRGGGAVLDADCAGWPVEARDGTRFLAFDDSARLAPGGRPTGAQKIRFERRQRAVTIFVSQVTGGVPTTFVLKGRQRGEGPVRTTWVTVDDAAWVPLRVEAGRGFDSVVLDAVDDPDGVWAADDLRLER